MVSPVFVSFGTEVVSPELTSAREFSKVDPCEVATIRFTPDCDLRLTTLAKNYLKTEMFLQASGERFLQRLSLLLQIPGKSTLQPATPYYVEKERSNEWIITIGIGNIRKSAVRIRGPDTKEEKAEALEFFFKQIVHLAQIAEEEPSDLLDEVRATKHLAVVLRQKTTC